MNVDAVYAPDLSTRYALPVFLGRLPAGVPALFGIGQQFSVSVLYQLLVEHLTHLFFLDGSRTGLASADSKVPKRSSTSGRSEYLLVPIGTLRSPTALSSAMW